VNAGINPDDIRKLEASSPEIVRFLRRLVEPGSDEAEMASRYVTQYREMFDEMLSAVEHRVPAGIMVVLAGEFDKSPDFRRGLRNSLLEPDVHEAMRTFVQGHFRNIGVNFEYKET
jgi:hypothetical protein